MSAYYDTLSGDFAYEHRLAARIARAIEDDIIARRLRLDDYVGSEPQLALRLSVAPSVPVAGMTLILGVDRFMSECRALTYFVGNAVATIVVSRWEGALDGDQLTLALAGRSSAPTGLSAIGETDPD